MKKQKKTVNNLNFLVNLKFKKFSKSLKRISGVCNSDIFPRLSNSCLSATLGMRLRPMQLEAMRRIFRRVLRKQGLIFLKVFPNFAPTRKPKDTRMGKGKGMPKFSICCVRKNKLIFELAFFKGFVMRALYFRALKKSAKQFKDKYRIW